MLLRAPCCTPPALPPSRFPWFVLSYASSGQICLCRYTSRLSSAQQSSSSSAESRN